MASKLRPKPTMEERLAALEARVAELERAHRADVARDHASPYTCANQEKKR